MSAYSRVVFLLLLLFFHSSQRCFCTDSNTFACHERERQALLRFRSSYTNTSDGPLGSWEGLNCCQWKGVGCDAISGHVIKLDLRNPITCPFSTFPRGDCVYGYDQFGAKALNPSLLELEHLNHLDLSGNSFDPSPIPKFLGSMKQLRYLNLTFSGFSGRIPHHLGNLSNLHVLDLSSNGDLYSTDMGWVSKLSSLKYIAMNDVRLEKAHNLFQALYLLPSLLQAEFSQCGITSLHITHAPINSSFLATVQLLHLSQNDLYGPIPNAFQNMTSIRDLDLSFNSLSTLPHWLGNLYSLVHLDLRWNLVSKSETSIMSILASTCSLQSLYLSNNIQRSGVSTLSFGSGNLSGCKAYDLEELLLSKIGIRDTFPSWLGELKDLKTLDLSNNFLYGPIPVSLGRCSSLVQLDLSYNLLEGTFSKSHLEKLSNIQSLQIGFNKLSVKIDSNWTPPFQFLTDIGMASCNIGTEFPKWVLKQERLLSLDLSNNSIWGIIPKNIGDQNPKLNNLVLTGNHIEGSIPTSLCKIEMLSILALSYNRLSGEIPNCWRNVSELFVINLSSNNLSGTIPSSFRNLSRVRWLTLSNNNLHGDLYQVLKNIQVSQILDLSRNQFTGMIPSWIGDTQWQGLQILRLSQNLLSGDIPSSLCQLDVLRILDLAGSNLSGSIPSCICNLSGMIDSSAQTMPTDYDEYGVLDNEGINQVLKGLQQEYTSNLKYLINIDLSNNNMEGLIPEGLTCLIELVGLNLSHNKLSGMIPGKIANMKSLESIDLSSNQLFGQIPNNMLSMTLLSVLNLSNNNFSGLIPKGAQFSTFGPSSYIGNPYLCGDPLSNACPGMITQPPTGLGFDDNDDDVDGSGKEKVLFYSVIVLGFITGFWGVIGFLLLNKSWRHACFRRVDNFVDFMFVEIGIRIARLKNKSKRNLVDH